MQVQGLESGVTAITAGFSHTCAIVNNGAFCWGNDSFGQLGDNTSNARSSLPIQVIGLNSGVKAIDSGGEHTCALANGSVECWGYNRYGQLGNGSTGQSPIPVRVQGMGSDNADISAGYMHTCALSNGHAYCWGDNTYGQLGDNSTTERDTPVQLHLP